MIKLVFGLALLLFIAWKVSNVFSNGGLEQIEFASNGTALLVVVGLLMILNWLFESLKWHLLIRKITAQKFQESVKDVLAGVSTSLLTPNRIGNFIGRTSSIEKESRTKAIIATIHSNIAQFLASIIFGTIGLTLTGVGSDFVDPTTVYISSSILIVVSLIFYFFPKAVDVNPINKLYSEQLKQGINHIQDESLGLKVSVLVMSLLRYLVFLIQFYLLLTLFKTDVDGSILIPGIAIVYLITAVLPSFLFGKLFVREASALFVLESMGVESAVILTTVFFLWIINLAIPAVAGAVVLMRR